MSSLHRMPAPAPTPRASGLPGASSMRRLAGTVQEAVGTVRDVATGTADVVGDALRALCTPTGLAGASVEALWLATHTVIYPLGLLGAGKDDGGHGYRIEHLPPVQRGLVISNVEAAGTPILLVHGLVDNHSVFALLKLLLRRRGFGSVTTMNYSILTRDIRVAAAQLAQEVETLVAETGYERIHVVGHSMGGLVARYYVTRLGGDERVHTLVTLGTPHGGTYTAYAWNSQLTKQLRPGSPLMQELAQPVARCRTRFVAYWSDLDQMMFPQRTASLHHRDLDVTNVPLHGVGHTSIPNMQSVVQGISATLAHLDSDGSTVAAGATPLVPPERQRRVP